MEMSIQQSLLFTTRELMKSAHVEHHGRWFHMERPILKAAGYLLQLEPHLRHQISLVQTSIYRLFTKVSSLARVLVLS